MVCIPIPVIQARIVIGGIVVGIIGCGIYIHGVTIIIHEPIVYATIIFQIPIEIASEQSAWRLETDDAG